MHSTDGLRLESEIYEAIAMARAQGRLEVALALAMTLEALTRRRPSVSLRSYWPMECLAGLVTASLHRPGAS